VEITSPLQEITCHMGSHSVTCHPAEMRGYCFLISASYPYPLKTIRICNSVSCPFRHC